MPNWYTTREAVRRAGAIQSTLWDSVIDAEIEAASREIDKLTGRRFIPVTATRRYSWPAPAPRAAWLLMLDDDLLSVTTLTKDDDTATAIAAADYFLEPGNDGPPYTWIEIDLSSAAYFSSLNTHQRAIRVTGSWGYSNDTASAGSVSSGLASDATATSLVCSDASKVDVGDTLLCESEQLFVSERATADTTADLNDTLTAAVSDVTITVTNGALVSAGEVILVDSERMLVQSIAGNDLTVQRAYEGTALAAHSSGTSVFAFRTLTVTRGVNGTTAATHANSTALSKYQPPADVRQLCRALALQRLALNQGGWMGVLGSGENSIEVRGQALLALVERVKRHYRRHLVGSV